MDVSECEKFIADPVQCKSNKLLTYPQLTFVLYLTGHGSREGVKFHDSEIDWNELLEVLFVGTKNLIESKAKDARNLKAMKIQLVVDTCHSGQLVRVFLDNWEK